MCQTLGTKLQGLCKVRAHDSEFALIDWFRQRATSHTRIKLGIGDDTAVVRFPQPADTLITVDMLMEGVHFAIPPTTPREIGRKALAVNLSDIAAMAGQPLAAVLSIALCNEHGSECARQLYEGLQSMAEEFDVAIAGGDTNIWNGPLVVSVTVLGEATGSGPVLRNGAQPGDWILATGDFGGSLTGKHVAFQPRVREALQLQQCVNLHAMIDVSDGLCADLHHILEESGVGAVLVERSIPISEAARDTNDGVSPLDHALGDGEDFELLFTVTASEGQNLLDKPPFDTPLSHIGEIVKDSGCLLRNPAGNTVTLDHKGWEHRFE